MRPKVGSLFSGVGGFELGFEAAGFEIAWQCEIDKDAISVLERHWPDVPRYGDIREVDPAVLAPVDVVVFGSPCQDFSVAGKRAGLDGERSGLFGEAIRIIRGLRPAPAFCVWENVPGALSSAGGRDFGAVLDALADIGALDIAWRVLDARWWGVPQRRRRIFLVADFGAERAGQVLFESTRGSGDSAACGKTRQRASGDAEDGAGVPVWKRRGGFGYSETHDLALALEHEGAGHSGGSMATPLIAAVANSVQASAGHHGHSSPRGDGSDNLVAVGVYPTGGTHGVSAADTLHAEGLSIVTPMAVRRLTPRETERLMSWPDDWTRYRADGSEIPDGPRYRMVGNGVVAPVAAWIGRRLFAALALEVQAAGTRTVGED